MTLRVRGASALLLVCSACATLLGAGCGELPPIRSAVGQGAGELAAACRAVFPRGCFEAVHTVHVAVSLTGHRGAVLGVSVGDTARRTLEGVLMTPEGVVLFEGAYAAGRTTVSRALPPLDRADFGPGLFSDLALVTLAPEAEPRAVGRLEDGRRVCRYVQGRKTRDVVLADDGRYWLVDYGEGVTPRRTVEARPPLSAGFARSLALRVPGLAGYAMRLTLVRAEAVECH